MIVVKKRPSYGNSVAVYYCSQDTLNIFGSVDKVPLYCCGVYFENGSVL